MTSLDECFCHLTNGGSSARFAGISGQRGHPLLPARRLISTLSFFASSSLALAVVICIQARLHRQSLRQTTPPSAIAVLAATSIYTPTGPCGGRRRRIAGCQSEAADRLRRRRRRATTTVAPRPAHGARSSSRPPAMGLHVRRAAPPVPPPCKCAEDGRASEWTPARPADRNPPAHLAPAG